MTEADIYQRIRGPFITLGFDLQRIEAHATAPAFPDVVVTGHLITVLVELKVIRRKRISFRPGQHQYLLKANKGGGAVIYAGNEVDEKMFILLPQYVTEDGSIDFDHATPCDPAALPTALLRTYRPSWYTPEVAP